MPTSEILNIASSLGISVSDKSAHRAWVKAAYLYIEFCIIPILPKELVTDKVTLQNKIILNLLQALAQEVSLGQKLDTASATQESTQCNQKFLPTKKCFISIKKLKERFKEPVHSHVTSTDYEFVSLNCKSKDKCVYCGKWKHSSGLLIGFMSSSEDKQLSFEDHTGSLQCCLLEAETDYFSSIVMLRSWNFIAADSGFLEVLDCPVVLARLESLILKEPTAVVPVENFEHHIDSTSSVKLNISGAFHSLRCFDWTHIILHLVPIRTRYEALNCCLSAQGSVSVMCDEHITRHRCESLKFGCAITISDVVRHSSKDIYRPQVDLKMTKKSQIRISGDGLELRRIFYENRMHSESTLTAKGSTVPSYSSSFCPVYVGRIKSIDSDDIGVLTLDDGHVILLCLYASRNMQFLGLRPGSVICVKRSHACTFEDQIVLTCCRYTHIQILEFSPHENAGMSLCQTPNQVRKNLPDDSTLHPIRLVTWVSLAKSLALLGNQNLNLDINQDKLQRKVNSILRRRWFSKFLDAVPASDQSGDECPVQTIIQLGSTPFSHVSLKTLHERAMRLARDAFSREYSTDELAQWSHIVIPSSELIDGNRLECSWSDNLISVSELQGNPSSGYLQLTDGSSTIMCVLTPLPRLAAEGNHETLRNVFTAEFSISYDVPVFPELQSLVRLREFAIVVERRWRRPDSLDTEAEDFGSEEESSDSECESDELHLYTTYFVLPQVGVQVLRQGSDPDREVVVRSILEDVASQSETEGSENVNKTSTNYNLLFIAHKTQVLKVSVESTFSLTALIFNGDSKPRECYVQFRDETVCNYQLVFPGMLLQVRADDEKSKELRTAASCTITSCEIKQVRSVTDLATCFNASETISFCAAARKLWNLNYFSTGFKPVWRVSSVVTCPPDGKQLMAVRGLIANRVSYKEDKFPGTDELSIRVDLRDGESTTDNKLSIYIAARCTAFPPVGLVPGVRVTFYRVKLIVSRKGFVYCKYTPTSFHVIEEASCVWREEPERYAVERSYCDTTEQSVGMKSTSGDLFHNDSVSSKEPDHPVIDSSRAYLYDLYSNLLEENEHNLVRLKVQITRVLSVHVAVVCAACGRERASRCGCQSRPSTSFVRNVVASDDKHVISFQAKTIITDGTGRAILYFSHRDRECFCHLLAIHDDEWNDVVSLLRQSTSGVVSYDCDKHDGKQLFERDADSANAIAQTLFVSLFNNVNCKTHPATEIIARRQFPSKKRSWNEDDYFDDLRGGSVVQSVFKVGTVPLDGGEDSSVRSLSLRLLKFNCVSLSRLWQTGRTDSGVSRLHATESFERSLLAL